MDGILRNPGDPGTNDRMMKKAARTDCSAHAGHVDDPCQYSRNDLRSMITPYFTRMSIFRVL